MHLPLQQGDCDHQQKMGDRFRAISGHSIVQSLRIVLPSRLTAQTKAKAAQRE